MERKKAALVTETMACEITSLGRTKLRQLADEAGAVRKIGRAYRINIEVLLAYIEREYAC